MSDFISDIWVFGSGFQPGATVELVEASASAQAFWFSDGQIRFSFPPSTINPGRYQLRVLNPGGVSSNMVPFTVLPALPPASCDFDQNDATPEIPIGYRLNCFFRDTSARSNVQWNWSSSASPLTFQPLDLGLATITASWDEGGDHHSRDFFYFITKPGFCDPAQLVFSEDWTKMIVGSEVQCYFSAGTPGIVFHGWTTAGFSAVSAQGEQAIRPWLVAYAQRFASNVLGQTQIVVHWTGPDGERSLTFPFTVVTKPEPPNIDPR